jgi:branched-chain amino acid transport system ATP-binding protein
MIGEALLSVEKLEVVYRRVATAVQGVSLGVPRGAIVALLGNNGAGKTTTLRAISGMVPVLAGTIAFNGSTITNRPAEKIARGGLLHVPAGRGVFPSLSVSDTLRLAASLAGLSRQDVGARLSEVADTFPRLAERMSQLAGTLSGGEQQMLALARGLITRPRLLMVDEMSQGLAPTIVAELFRVLDRFTAQGAAVLLVEQFVAQALALANRAYVLEKGEVTFAGAAEDLAADEEFVKGSYLGEVSAAASDGTPAGPDGRHGAPPPRRLAEEVLVSLPPTLLRSLQDRATRDGVAVSDLVRDVVEGSLEPVAPPSKARSPRQAGAGSRRGR